MPTRSLHVGALSVIAGAVLTACGGGGDDPPAIPTATVTGVVADGPLSNVVVCYDLDSNGRCDTGEPRATTDTDGRFSFTVQLSLSGQRQVVAEVPATSVDKDTGAAVGTAFTLRTPATRASGDHDVFVSPLTTLVADRADLHGVPVADATTSVQRELGLAKSPLGHFVRDADAQSATMARVVLGVSLQTARLADGASLSTDARQALMAATVQGDLPAIASRVRASSATTPAAISAEVTAAVMQERNLDASTVAGQAATASALKAAATGGTTGPFFSMRRFQYTDADNYAMNVFTGDNTPGADGSYFASELRVNRAGGSLQPFNRNQAYWVASSSSWEVCAAAWQVSRSWPATGTGKLQTGEYCGASKSQTRVAEYDVAGKRMADVVAAVRAWPMRDSPGADTDANGMPTRWGPEPARLGDAVFPAGARFQMREQTSDIGDTERYGLTDKPRVVPASGTGTYRHAVTIADLKRMSGDLVTAGAVISNLNTVFLEDVPFDQTDPLLTDVKRYRVAFDPASDKVRHYVCDLVTASSASQNCQPVGDGSSAVAAQGDGRVLRFTTGYPEALTQRFKRQRLFVERSGAVFGGHRDLQQLRYHQRPNTVAADALRRALAIPDPAPATAPAARGEFVTLRNLTYTDANNYSYRLFSGDDTKLDAQGYITLDEERTTRSGGVNIPYAPNRLYWTGTEWYDCPANGIGVNRVNSKAPFDSAYCKGFLDERQSNTVVTLDGRNIADVVRDIRWYSSRDGTFNYANWGPNPDVHTQLAAASFPAGATMEYRGTTRKATPFAIYTAAGDQTRVPPAANTSQPYANWAFTTSLEQFIAANPGDLKGATTLNGNIAFHVHNYTLATPAAPQYTTAVEIRVAFDAEGNKARFYRNYRLAATGVSAGYERLLDTTYSIETLGNVRVLKFAAMPEGFEREYGFQRMYAERNGGVWYAGKDFMGTEPVFSIRLNGTAAEALGRSLGLQ